MTSHIKNGDRWVKEHTENSSTTILQSRGQEIQDGVQNGRQSPKIAMSHFSRVNIAPDAKKTASKRFMVFSCSIGCCGQHIKSSCCFDFYVNDAILFVLSESNRKFRCISTSYCGKPGNIIQISSHIFEISDIFLHKITSSLKNDCQEWTVGHVANFCWSSTDSDCRQIDVNAASRDSAECMLWARGINRIDSSRGGRLNDDDQPRARTILLYPSSTSIILKKGIAQHELENCVISRPRYILGLKLFYISTKNNFSLESNCHSIKKCRLGESPIDRIELDCGQYRA
ncbi:hypothetical protein GQR58_026672 [Nymphon striatum]|nr:hypothetical protein GQR58_026672 [Nymphon striatum]